MNMVRVTCAIVPMIALVASAEQVGFERAFEGNIMTLTQQRRPVLVYQEDGYPFKPYVKQLFSPSGANVLLDAPADHLHHHGLMFAIAVDDVDFWAETPGCGKQVLVIEEKEAGTEYPELSKALDRRLKWVKDDQTVLLQERRTLWIAKLEGVNATTIAWRTQLSLPEGKESAKLTGSHYFGLGMRFVESMDRVATFMNSEGAEGEIVRGEERNTPARWCACTGPIDGKPVTVAIFDAPTNPRHPAVWFTMPVTFAYMSATLNLHKEPMTMLPGTPIDLMYGVLVWDGAVSKEDIESAYQKWVKALER